MSNVFFFEYEMGRKILPAMEELFRRAGIDGVFSPGESVAIKIHPGELGNTTYVRPVFVHKVVEMVKNAGGKPILDDVGILASLDAVAIDKASLDLVDKASPIHPLDVSPPDIMGKINGTRSTVHMEVAEELGLGSLSYHLERI